jgi:hypothetical protein
MILSGIALAAGFVFALRSQLNTYRIAQAEEQLKTQLDEYARRQKFLSLEQKRAMSADEIDRAGRWNGLERLKLDRETPPRDVSVQKVVSTAPVKESRANQNDRVRNRPVRSGSPGKAAKIVKLVKTGKTAMVVSAVKKNRKRQ